MRHLTNGEPGTRAEVESGVERTLLYRKKYGGKLGVFTAELIETGEFMGWFHLRPDRKAFEELGADGVFARTLAANKASRRVMEKIGMSFVEEFIDPDYPRQGPAVRYRMTRADRRAG